MGILSRPSLLVLFAVLASSWPAQTFAGSKLPGFEVKAAERSEEYERDVDQVASSAQEQAIFKLTALLKKYKGTPQEPVLLAKLAELQQQYSAILFRIGHGYIRRNEGADLTRYSKSIQQCISTLNVLVKNYPAYEGVPHAYFMRAKSYEELSSKDLAVSDYQFLVKKFPDAEDTPAAYMALADVAITANDHPKAIQYLSEVEKLPKDPHYPFALYKLGWSYYNLKNIPKALSYLERHVKYYRPVAGQTSGEEDGSTDPIMSDRALQENSLLDIALFYFEGYEEGDPQYRLSEAMGYFKKLEPASAYGKMLVRMAKMLRSHGHEADLVSFKDQVLASEQDLPESLEVALTTYEFQLNKRRYSQVVESAKDFVRVYSKQGGKESFGPYFVQAQKLLLDTAEGLQGIILKNKGNDEIKQLTIALAAIYESFTRIVPDEDPRVPRVHYNLAETLFAIKDYDAATEHYRWVALHEKGHATSDVSADANLKAIASRYEVLRLKQLAGRDVTAKPFPPVDAKVPTIDPLLQQWVGWVDAQAEQRRAKDVEKQERVDAFLFEANRALYAAGDIANAISRLRRFAEKNPKSSYAIPSATLVVDTTIASGNWQRTYELALALQSERTWHGTEFGKRLAGLAADACFKLMEERFARKEYAEILKGAADFFKLYGSSDRYPDMLRLSAQAALGSGDKLLARYYFSRLIEEKPDSDGMGDALLARSVLNEENYQFTAAAADARAFLLLSADRYRPAQTDALRKKALALTWLSGDATELRAALENRALCPESLSGLCDKYSALVDLSSSDRSGTEEETRRALKAAKAGSGANRVLWGLVALEGAMHLEYRERMFLLRQVSSGWSELSALEQYTVLPNVTKSLVRTFEINRQEMKDIAPLRANEKYIKRRVEVVREIEAAATKAMTLPWSRLRAELLNEVAALYLEFSKDLMKIPAPKGLPPGELALYEDTVHKLALPFEEKGQELRGKAFEVASRFAIEESAFRKIAEPFFADNPRLSKANEETLKLAETLETPPALSVKFLASADPAGSWKILSESGKAELSSSAHPDLRLKRAWISAIEAGRWAQVSFLMSEAGAKKLIPEGVLGLMRSVAFSKAGAQGEGLLELDAVRNKLSPEGIPFVTFTLIEYSARACAQDKIPEWLKDLKLEQLNQTQKQSFAIASALVSSGSKKR